MHAHHTAVVLLFQSKLWWPRPPAERNPELGRPGTRGTHDYTQWLFALDEPSGFNMHAPVPDAETIRKFRFRTELRRNFSDLPGSHACVLWVGDARQRAAESDSDIKLCRTRRKLGYTFELHTIEISYQRSTGVNRCASLGPRSSRHSVTGGAMIETAHRGLPSVLLAVWLFASLPTVVSPQTGAQKQNQPAAALSPQELFKRLSPSVFVVLGHAHRITCR
jgi:hypothetical protein